MTALALAAGITSHAQTVSDKKAKRQKEEIVNVRVNAEQIFRKDI